MSKQDGILSEDAIQSLQQLQETINRVAESHKVALKKLGLPAAIENLVGQYENMTNGIGDEIKKMMDSLDSWESPTLKAIGELGKNPPSFLHVPYVPTMPRQEDKPLSMIVNIITDEYIVKRVEHQGEVLNIFILPEEKAEPSDDGEDHTLH